MIGSGPEYDSALTLFSPDGRLYQVEYALEAVRKGTTVIGIRCSNGVVLASELRLTSLQERTLYDKLFEIDEAIGALVSGLSADSRLLIDYTRTLAQIHRLTFGEAIPVYSLAKKLCDHIQTYTQYGGLRPFGIQMIMGGVDKVPQLYVTDPIGSFWSYKAHALGQNANQVIEILEKEYRPTLTVDEGILLASKILKQVADSTLTPERLDVGKVTEKERRFTRLDQAALQQLLD